jgi:hypothetical protein
MCPMQGNHRARCGENSEHVREGRPLVPSLNEGVKKESLQMRVEGGGMRVPHLSGADKSRVGDIFLALSP